MSGAVPPWRTLVRAALRTLLVVGVLVALLVVVASTGLGMGLVLPWALARAAPEGWTVSVASAGGAWGRRVHLTGVSMQGPETSVTADEVLLEYRLLPLLERTIDVRRLHLVRPAMEGALPDSAPADAEPPDESGESMLHRVLSGSPLGGWTLRLGELRVDEARAVLEGSSGPYRVEQAHLAGVVDMSPHGTSVRLDSLAVEMIPPPTPGSHEASGPGRLHVAARLHEGVLAVESLQMRTPRSHVEGVGELLVAPVPGYVDEVDFRLDADPLDLRDLPIQLPARVAADPILTLHLEAKGPPHGAAIVLEARGPGSATLRANGLLRAAADPTKETADSAALRADARLVVDLAEWATSPYAGQLTADVDVELRALDPAAAIDLRGTFLHTPPVDAPEDVLGDPIRVAVDAVRAPAPAADTTAQVLEATATLYRPSALFGGALAEAEWNELGTLAAQVDGHRASWQVDLLLDSGSVEGSGAVSWAENERELIVDRVRARRLDFATLAARMPPSSLTADVSGHVAGASITELVGNVDVLVDSSHLGEAIIDTLSLSAELVEGSISGSAFLASYRGRLESDYHVALTESLVEATLTRIEGTAPLDPVEAIGAAVPLIDSAAALIDSAGAAVDSIAEPRPAAWTMKGHAVATWALGDARRGTLEAVLDTSSIGSLRLTGVTVEGELLGDSLTARLRADASALLDAPAAFTAFASGKGSSLADWTGLLELHATRFHLAADSASRSGTTDSVTVQVVASEPGRFALEGRVLPGEGGVVNLSGSGTAIESDIAFDFSAVGTLDAPAQLLRGGTIERLALQMSAVRSSTGWSAFAMELLATDAGGWGGIVADTVRASLRYDSAGMALDTVFVDSNVLALAGSGMLPISASDSGTVDFTAHFDLEPMRDHTASELPTIGGNELSAVVSGSTDSIEVAVSAAMTALVHRDVRVAGFEGEVLGLFRPPFSDLMGLVSGNARVSLDRIVLPDSEIGNFTLAVDGTPDSLRLEARALVDESRGGEMDARVDPTPDGRTMDIDRLELQLDEDEWQMVQPAVLEFRDGFALRGFELRAGEQAISIDGGLTAAGALDLTAAMDSTDLGTIADLVGFPRLDGWLGGRASLGGTKDAPEGTVDLSLGYHAEGESPTRGRILLEADGRQVDAEVALEDADGGVLTVAGLVPLQQGEEVDLSVSAESFDIRSGVVFVDAEQLSELEGRVYAQLAVSGALDDIGFEGPISLRNGLARSPSVGVTWEEIYVFGRGEGRSLVVDSALVEAGSGSMRALGSVTVEEEIAIDLEASFDEFQAIQTNAYQAAMSGGLRVAGTPLEPVIEGEVTMESLDVYIDERPTDGGLEDVTLTPEDFELLRERFGYIVVEEDLRPQTSELLTADISVEFGPDSWIRSRSSPEMAVAFTGEVDLQLRPGEEPQLQGTLTTTPERGYIAQFGKRFSPREGTVTLAGMPAAAELDLSATYTVPSHANPDGAEATIVLGVNGTQDNLQLTLSSEPPMENADIVSYIATGRPAASTFALGDADEAESPEADQPGGGLAETGAGIAVGQVLSSIETAAQTGVGLDVVEIRREGIRGATLAAGKYVSPRLYVGFAQPILRRERDGLSIGDQNGSEIEVELLAIEGLLLNLEGSASSLSVFLRGRVAY